MMDTLLQEAEALARLPESNSALFELSRKDAGESKAATPPAHSRQDATIVSYATTWKELLTVLVRESDLRDMAWDVRPPDFAQLDARDEIMDVLRSGPVRPYSQAQLCASLGGAYRCGRRRSDSPICSLWLISDYSFLHDL